MEKKTKSQILAMSEDERKVYYALKLADLKKEEKALNLEIARKKQAEKAKNRSKVNHAKYIIAGEFLASPDAKKFLENLAKTNKFPARTALGLNLLMAELGFNITFLAVD